MVGDESLQRCLHDLTDVEVELGGHCVEFCLIVVGDATNEGAVRMLRRKN